MEKAKLIASGFTWTMFNSIISVVYGVISVPFLINYFGKEQYGLIGIAISVNLYIQLIDMGMAHTNIRFLSEYIAKKETSLIQRLFSLTLFFYLIVGIINSLVLFVISFYNDVFFNVTPQQATILRNLLWILALNATFSWVSTAFDQLLTANEMISWVKKRASILKLFQFLILFLTISFRWSIEYYFFAYTFVLTLILPISVNRIRIVLPEIKTRFRFDSETFHIVFPYAISVFAMGISQFCVFNFRPLILGNISGPSAVAEYSVMITISSVITIITGSCLQVFLPILTRMRAENRNDDVQTILKDGTRILSIILVFVTSILILSMDEILDIYVGRDFASISLWTSILLLSLVTGHRNVMTALVFTETKVRSVAVMGAITMVIALMLYIVLVPYLGIGGIVIGFLVHELLHTLFYYVYFLPQRLSINSKDIFQKDFLPTFLVSVVIACCIYLLFDNTQYPSIIRLILKSLTFVISYAIAAYTLRIVRKEDLQYITKKRN